MFHIVDNKRFETTVKNISNLLDENSFLLITDVIYDDNRFEVTGAEHFKARNYKYYNSVLLNNDLEIKKTINVFSFMHPRTIFPKNKFRKFLFKAFNKTLASILKKFPNVGGELIGRFFYIIDCLLNNFNVDGYSTKLLIIAKRKKV